MSLTLQPDVAGLYALPPDLPDHIGAWAVDCGTKRQAPPLSIHVSSPMAEIPASTSDPERIRLWFVRVTDLETLEAAARTVLSDEERAISNSRRWEWDRSSYLAAHLAKRRAVAAALRVEPREVEFETSPLGRPLVCRSSRSGTDTEIHLSISHCRGLAAVALSPHPVGIDVEQVISTPDLVNVLRANFSAEIAQAIGQLPAGERHRAFFRIWVLGEALLKATGQGFALEMNSFSASISGPVRLVRAPRGWGPLGRWRLGLVVNAGAPEANRKITAGLRRRP